MLMWILKKLSERVVHCQNRKALAWIIHLVIHSYCLSLEIYLVLIQARHLNCSFFINKWPIGRQLENTFVNHQSIQATPKYLYFFKETIKTAITPVHFQRRTINTTPHEWAGMILFVLGGSLRPRLGCGAFLPMPWWNIWDTFEPDLGWLMN